MFFYKILYWIVYSLIRPKVVEIQGLENLPKNEGFLIVANHHNSYDPLAIAAALYAFLKFICNPSKRKFILLAQSISKKISGNTTLSVASSLWAWILLDICRLRVRVYLEQ